MLSLSNFNNKLDYFQLISLGIHIGHSFKNCLLFAAWLIYGFRQEISIISLFRFVSMFRLGFSFINSAVFKRRPI